MISLTRTTAPRPHLPPRSRMNPESITRRLTDLLGRSVGTPAAHVIANDLWEAAIDGTLEIGARLPTTRQLAVALGVSPVSVERAYADLEERGVIVTRPGEGTFVALPENAEAELARRQAFLELCRATVERARELGYDVDELMKELEGYRMAGLHTSTRGEG